MARVRIFDKVTSSFLGEVCVSVDKIRILESDFVVEYATK